MEELLNVKVDRTQYDYNAKILEKYARKNPKTKSMLFYRVGDTVEVIKDDASRIPDYLLSVKEKGATAVITFFNFLSYEDQDRAMANDYFRNKIFSGCRELGLQVEDFFWLTIKNTLPLVLGLRELDYLCSQKGIGFVKTYHSPFDD